MTKIFQLHPLAKIVRYSARVHGIPELGLFKGRFADLKADIINQFMLAIQLSKCRSVAEQNSRIGVNFFKPLLKELNKFAILCPKSIIMC